MLHIVNETEEWFYQLKGDMLLKIVENNAFRDVIIKEGEMFLLPGMPLYSVGRNPTFHAIRSIWNGKKNSEQIVRYH